MRACLEVEQSGAASLKAYLLKVPARAESLPFCLPGWPQAASVIAAPTPQHWCSDLLLTTRTVSITDRSIHLEGHWAHLAQDCATSGFWRWDVIVRSSAEINAFVESVGHLTCPWSMEPLLMSFGSQ